MMNEIALTSCCRRLVQVGMHLLFKVRQIRPTYVKFNIGSLDTIGSECLFLCKCLIACWRAYLHACLACLSVCHALRMGSWFAQRLFSL
jgi:hypothetical protein